MEKTPNNDKDRDLEDLRDETYSDKTIQGKGFSFKRGIPNFYEKDLTEVEFRQGETTESAKIRENKENVAKNLKIGDLIQWESQGVTQFNEPKTVTGITNDRKWVFVEGSETGIPIEQVSTVS